MSAMLRFFAFPGRPTRLLIVSAVLAMMAMVNVMAMNGWHDSMPEHDDHSVEMSEAVHAHGFEHPHGSDAPQGAPDSGLHHAMHSAIHGFADMAHMGDFGPSRLIVADTWSITMDDLRRGLSPEALLRPPRI